MLLRDNAFQIMLIQTANKFQPFGLQSTVYRAELMPLFLVLLSYWTRFQRIFESKVMDESIRWIILNVGILFHIYFHKITEENIYHEL